MSGEPFVFTPKTVIADALDLGPAVVEAFRSLGLMCPGRTPKREWCAAIEKETLADAALFHEVDLEAILRTLNGLGIPGKSDP
jgi:hypothetical protein